MGTEPSGNVTTSDYLGLGEGICEGYTIQVKDMILKAALEERQALDALEIEAFGGHLDEGTEV